jgi:diacylglycerol kinase (ATP)
LKRHSFWAALRFAWAGVARTFGREPNFRRELALGVTAVALALWLRASLVPILIVSGLVLALELVNSAVEAAVDIASPERSELAGAAKDAAAGAVLLASAAALAVGLVHLGPPLWLRLRDLAGLG